MKRKHKSNLIPDTYNKIEKNIAKISREPMEYDIITKYDWYEYPETVISMNLPFGALRLMTELLAVYAP